MSNIINDISVWNYVRGNTKYDGELEYRMLKEELEEFSVSRNKANAAKELADIAFVALGSLYKLSGANSFKAEAIMTEVIKANQAKGTKKVEGKVQKGTTYSNPETLIKKILQEDASLWGSYLDDNSHIYD